MGLLDRVTNRAAADAVAPLREQVEQLSWTNELLTEQLEEIMHVGGGSTHLVERLADLELALEDVNWTRLDFETNQDFSRQGLKRIAALSRLFFLKNPLINRAVTLQAQYVWGQGVSIHASHPDVDAVVQTFLDDKKNQAELTSHQARTLKEQDLQVEGNLFFVLFTNKLTGRVRVRSVPFDEIDSVIKNPDDRQEPWYYKRTHVRETLADDGAKRQEVLTEYYPDWRYNPPAKERKLQIGGSKVNWDAPIYHVKVGGLSIMGFGVPETYQALDWALAYKGFLEDWATITKAYARFAWDLKTVGGAKGVAAAKSKLQTTVSTGSSSGMADKNPPGTAAQTFASYAGGATLQPIRTAGATTSAEDGRRLLLMVCAATGLPESFFGDVSVGTLATAKSLDRPTELKFTDRQTLWGDIHEALLQYVVDQSAVAPKGKLKGTKVWNDEQDEQYVKLADVDVLDDQGNPTGETEETPRAIDVDFPPILEHDKLADIQAIVEAATLGGKTMAGTIDEKTVSRLLLLALGEDDIDDLLELLFPDEEEGAADTEDVPPTPQGDQSVPQIPQAPVTPPDQTKGASEVLTIPNTEARLTESLIELKRAIVAFANRAE